MHEHEGSWRCLRLRRTAKRSRSEAGRHRRQRCAAREGTPLSVRHCLPPLFASVVKKRRTLHRYAAHYRPSPKSGTTSAPQMNPGSSLD
jgi:hypothetical protein